MTFVRSLDSDSLSTALGLHDHCNVFFYSKWSQHKSAEYLSQLSELEASGARHSHFSFFIRDPEVTLVVYFATCDSYMLVEG